MGFFEILAVIILLYYLICILLWTLLDSDVELAWNENFGTSLSSMKGKVVWIVGASSGIGKGLSLTLAEHGVKLVLSSRRVLELEKVKQEALEKSNGLLASQDILVLHMDLLAFDTHQYCLDEVKRHFGKLDILVNNAGRSQRASWDKIDIKVDKELFELDVFSIVHLSRIVVRYFKSNNTKGHVGITSSAAGLLTPPFSASYVAAKHAIHGYFQSLSIEEPSIHSTLFCPGPVATDFLKESFTDVAGQKYGQPIRNTDKRMTAARCGKLFAIALANKTSVSWCGLFPINISIYLCLYYPNITRMALKLIGPESIKKIREGQ